MRMYSEIELQIQPRWFTGAQWTNGTAQRELIAEHYAAIAEAERQERKPKQKYVPNTKPWEPWWAKKS